MIIDTAAIGRYIINMQVPTNDTNLFPKVFEYYNCIPCMVERSRPAYKLSFINSASYSKQV